MIERMYRLSCTVAALFFVSGMCSAQVTIEPASPRAQETVRLKVGPLDSGEYIPGSADVIMNANRITVSLRYPDVVAVPPPLPPIDITLGQLPAGDYVVDFVKKSSNGTPFGTTVTRSFTVVNPTRGPVYPWANFTDLWWDPAESGWGLGITQHVSDALFATWFVYGADGKPIWYVLPGGTWTYVFTFAGPVYKTTGPYYGGPFNPAAVTVTLAGTATLNFTHYDRATFTYTVDGVTATKTIVRQPF